ncbi:MAG: MFS transporter [Desulfarculales bacterium]|jgi:predicted MFS family arabinose efflux permease|nr:MFS transporter [Desulfarculales bacterium]
METNVQIPRINGRAWLMVVIAWIGYMIMNLSNFSIGVMMPDIIRDLELSLREAGWLSASAWLMKAALTLPVAILVAKFNPKYLLQAIFITVAAGVIMQGLAQNYLMLFIGRSLVYCVAGAVLAPLAVLKISMIAKERMVFINGLENFTGPAGQAMGTAVVPFLIATMGGWRDTLLLLGVVTVAVNIIWALSVRKEAGITADQKSGGKIKLLAPLREALRYKTVWLLALGWPGTGFVWNATYSFWPTYAVDTLGITMAQAGLVLGLLPFGSMVGSLTAPKLTDLMGVDKLMICTWGFILPFAYGSLLFTDSIPLLCLLSFFAGYGAYAFVPIAFTAIYKIPAISPRAVAMGIAFIVMFNGLGGGLGGLLVGYLGAELGLASALKICCLSPFIFGLLTLFLPETGRKAQARGLAGNIRY